MGYVALGRDRAGELNSDELERIVTIMQNPAQYKIPSYFLNRQKDIIDGKYYQVSLDFTWTSWLEITLM
jgi:hypothetical protein